MPHPNNERLDLASFELARVRRFFWILVDSSDLEWRCSLVEPWIFSLQLFKNLLIAIE